MEVLESGESEEQITRACEELEAIYRTCSQSHDVANIELIATANDTDGSVTRVEFYQGGTLLGEATTAPYSFTWLSPDVGDHTLTAVAIDDSGASTTSTTVDVSVILNIPGC